MVKAHVRNSLGISSGRGGCVGGGMAGEGGDGGGSVGETEEEKEIKNSIPGFTKFQIIMCIP